MLENERAFDADKLNSKFMLIVGLENPGLCILGPHDKSSPKHIRGNARAAAYASPWGCSFEIEGDTEGMAFDDSPLSWIPR